MKLYLYQGGNGCGTTFFGVQLASSKEEAKKLLEKDFPGFTVTSLSDRTDELILMVERVKDDK